MFNVVSLKRQHKRALSSEITEVRPIITRAANQTSPYFSNFEDCVFLKSERGGNFSYRAQEDFEVITFAVEGVMSLTSDSSPDQKLQRGDIANTLLAAGESLPIFFEPQSEMLQVLLKPNAQASHKQPKSKCNIFSSQMFPVEHKKNFTVQHLHYHGSPMQLATPGVCISLLQYQSGSFSLILKNNSACFAFALEGSMQLGSEEIHRGDFAMVDCQEEISMHVPEHCALFLLETCAGL